MITHNTVFTITIPEWTKKVQIGVIASEFYSKKDKLPDNLVGAKLKKIGRDFFYVDEKDRRILKNAAKQGTAKYWNANGQAFYSTNMHWKTRATIVDFYHSYFKKYIQEQLAEPFPIFLNYTLDFNLQIFDVYTSNTPDITNMWILAKIFEDTVVSLGLLKDDSPEFRCHTGYGYTLVKNAEDRKLAITFKYNKK